MKNYNPPPQTIEQRVAYNIWYMRRCILRISQRALAIRLGVAASTVGAYEEGRAIPNVARLLALTKIFGVTLEEFVNHACPSNPGA